MFDMMINSVFGMFGMVARVLFSVFLGILSVASEPKPEEWNGEEPEEDEQQ